MKKGAALATIESPDVGNASADLDKANADLVAADHDMRRQKELYDAHAGSERDYESAQDNAGKAKAEMERARQKAPAVLLLRWPPIGRRPMRKEGRRSVGCRLEAGAPAVSL